MMFKGECPDFIRRSPVGFFLARGLDVHNALVSDSVLNGDVEVIDVAPEASWNVRLPIRPLLFRCHDGKPRAPQTLP